MRTNIVLYGGNARKNCHFTAFFWYYPDIMFKKLLALSLLIFPLSAEARPVSYPDGWTAMLMNNGEYNSAHIHYSPTAKYSLGYRFEHRRDTNAELHLGQLNYLVNRWNEHGAQANIYLKGAAGVALDDGDSFGAGSVGIAADWETRRYFTSYENRYITAGPIEHGFTQTGRIGITPYIGDYGDVHTWLMLQVEHRPEAKENFEVTPMVRFFKGTHLGEFGISNQGKILFNFIERF